MSDDTQTLDGQVDYGTPERRNKSKLKTTSRGVTKNGNVISTGLTDTEHTMIDVLLNNGMISTSHYDIGYRLRELFYSFNKGITSDLSSIGGSGYSEFVNDAEIGDASDLRETRYYNIIAGIKTPYRAIIRCICIENSQYRIANKSLLDKCFTALEKSFKESERK